MLILLCRIARCFCRLIYEFDINEYDENDETETINHIRWCHDTICINDTKKSTLLTLLVIVLSIHKKYYYYEFVSSKFVIFVFLIFRFFFLLLFAGELTTKNTDR